MVGQTPQDTPFGLEPNLAAGLAYLLGLVGGLVMLLGGGTNRFVKWAAAQSITLSVTYIVFFIALQVLNAMLGIAHLWILWPITLVVGMIVGILMIVAWLYTSITAFQGKEVRLPLIADLTDRFFGGQFA